MPSGIIKVRLAVGTIVNNVFIIMPANMAAETRRISQGILFY